MKFIKLSFLLLCLLSFSLVTNAQSKVTYEDITAEALSLSPEKYLSKPICLTIKFKQTEQLSYFFGRTNISSDKYIQFAATGTRDVKIIAKKQDFFDDIKKIKDGSMVKLCGRVKHITRANVRDHAQVYYLELEKIDE